MRIGEAKLPVPKLSKLEFQIMEVLWAKGDASIREIQEVFPIKGRPAYTTVQPTVYRMEGKEAVHRVNRNLGKYNAATRGSLLLFAAIPAWLLSAALSLGFRPTGQVAAHLGILALSGWILEHGIPGAYDEALAGSLLEAIPLRAAPTPDSGHDASPLLGLYN